MRLVPPFIALLIGISILPRLLKTLTTTLLGLTSGILPDANDIEFIAFSWIPLFLGFMILSNYTEVIVLPNGIKIKKYAFIWTLAINWLG
jgi:hypothetical protein